MSHKFNLKNWIQLTACLLLLMSVLGYAHYERKMEQKILNCMAGDIKQERCTVKNPRVNYVQNPVGIDSQDIYFSWEPETEQKAYAIVVKKSTAQGAVSEETEEIIWNSGIVFSSETIRIPYKGKLPEDGTTYEYRVFVFDKETELSYSETAFFETGFINGQPFEEAQLISMNPEENIYEDGQAVYYHSFEAKPGNVVKATFYGSSLGIYDAYLNGKRIGDDELKPGWTDYNDTLLYNAYDVTEYIGEMNTIAAMVGTGWWCGRNGFGTYGYRQPAFICSLVIEYEDGSCEVINTGNEWKYCKNTAVRFADFFNGETYDASKLTTMQISQGEQVPAADEKDVYISSDFTGNYKSFYGYPVKRLTQMDCKMQQAYVYDGVTEDGSDFGAVNVTRSYLRNKMDAEGTSMFPIVLKKGETLIVDLGQNMTGVPHLEYKAEKGTVIEILCAEMLNDSGEEERGNDGPRGSLYRANYRSASTTVKVIAGDEKDSVIYEPKFYYSGFRYLSLTADTDITIYDLSGGFMGNSAPAIGYMTADNELVDRLWQNVYWSQRNNFSLIATDCPQRDERIGWMGDLCSFAETSMYTQDLYSFYKKWTADVRDAQTQEGAYTDTVPATIITGSGNAGWAEAGILVPLFVYRQYGDSDLLKEHYPSMSRYMDYLASISSYKPEDKRMGPLTTFGDWLATEYSDSAMLSALWYEADAMAMEEIALLLGEKTDAEKYRKLHREINEYIMETYLYKMPWNRDGSLKTEESEYSLSQTEMLFLLKYAGLTQKQEQLIVAKLRQSITDNDYKVMTGFAGTPLLLPVLTEYGMGQEAYKILLCEENPSWLYSVKQGATTIWERYDSYTVEEGFADEGMNSFNHFNEGSVAQWMYESMLGISVDVSKEQPIAICPVIPEEDIGITKVSGWHDSVYGRIALGWEKERDGLIRISLTIPENVKASVELPLEGMKKTVISGGEYEWKGKYKLLE